MLSFVRIAALSAGLYALAAVPAFAQFTITFDEQGVCFGCTGFTYGPDPSHTFSGNVLIYGLPQTVTSGTVNILDATVATVVSDTLNFFANLADGKSNEMIFYSYDTGSLLADVGNTVLFPTADVTGATEDANFRFNYANLYFGTSAAVPEPATLALIGAGLGAMGFLKWRRKRKAQAV